MDNTEKRKWNDETIGRVFGIIDEILYSIALYRMINPKERDGSVFDPIIRKFWITISNNAILMGIINWCKVFGSENRNDTHYSHFVEPESFYNKLPGMQFEEYAKKMLNIRNKFAAHEDPFDERGKIPDFDMAMIIMEAFKNTVQEEYDIPELPSILGTYKAYLYQIQSCLENCKTDWDIPEIDE